MVTGKKKIDLDGTKVGRVEVYEAYNRQVYVLKVTYSNLLDADTVVQIMTRD